MTIYELNNVLTNLAISNYLVNDAFVGDVYTINGKENKFACFVATPMNAVKDSTGLIKYNYILYYIDRLTKAEDNIDFVQSDAVNLLSGVLNYIEEQGIQVEPGYEFTLFRQKFSDWCAGAYVSVDIYVPYNDCNDSEFNLSGYGLTELIVDRNGIYVPEGFDGFDRVTINVPQVGATEEWVDNEIDTKLTGYATESWVSDHFSDVVMFNTSPLPSFIRQYSHYTGSISSYIIIDSTPTYIGTSEVGLAFNNGNIHYLGSNFYKGTLVGDGQMSQYVSTVLSDYASKFWVKSWVQSQGYLTSIPASYATKNWVNNQGYLKVEDLNGLATQSWISNQGFVSSSSISDMATTTWVRQQGYITTSALSDYATITWVGLQGYITVDDLCGYATEEWTRNWVDNQGFIKQCDLEPYATKNWVENQGYINQDELDEALESYATMDWVNGQGFATESWVSENYIDNTEIQDYATIEYVTNNYVDNTTIENYVTVEDLGEDLEGYATEDWVSNNFIAGSNVWTGTIDDWEELTDEERCSYMIALVVED